MTEVINNYFQEIFNRESNFQEQEKKQHVDRIEIIPVSVQQVSKLLEELDIRKAHEPDEVANWILQECSKQLAEKIHDITVRSLTEGKVPRDWKSCNFLLLLPLHITITPCLVLSES